MKNRVIKIEEMLGPDRRSFQISTVSDEVWRKIINMAKHNTLTGLPEGVDPKGSLNQPALHLEMKKFRDELKNPNESRAFLVKAGFLNEDGTISKRYSP